MRNALLYLLLAAGLSAQQRPYIRATADAAVSATPDQARVTVGVVTVAASAQEASAQNSRLTEAVLAAVRGLLRAGDEVKTVSYSLTPNYNYPQNQAPVLTGYTATNLVQVTTADLSLVGRIIDTATGAGANRVQSLSFGLKDSQNVESLALRQAAARAKTQADAIAAGLLVRTGAIISATEGSQVIPVDVRTPSLGSGTGTTPIESGLVEVRATVTLELEILQ